MDDFILVISYRVFAESQAQQLISVNLQGIGLTNQGMLELEKHIQRLSSLQYLNLSDNRLMKFLTFPLMNFVTTLKSFTIKYCGLVLPPWASGVTADSMRSFLHSSNVDLPRDVASRLDADIVAQWLPHFSALKRLGISDNIQLGDDGVTALLSALTGTFASCSS
jgi:hypothetical protein